ncbi:hypothetical protein MPRS_19540 [Mycobacterium paraseoulense]|nr:hypothetical protein MPRS_19540 [Mycobacterium paraseoulense]
MLGIRLAVAHALEDHGPIFRDAMPGPDRFMLDRLARRRVGGVDAARIAGAPPTDRPDGRRW